MATDDGTTTDPVSPQAFERVKRERDELKGQAEQAAKALSDVRFRDAAYEHFKQAGVSDPFGVANLAMRDITLRDTPADKAASKLDAWLEEQKALWVPPTPAAPAAEAEAAPAKPKPSAYAGPNPGAPGTPAAFEPMIVGSQRWTEWAKGKTGEEQVAAVKRGEAVVPQTVRDAQRTAKAGPL